MVKAATKTCPRCGKTVTTRSTFCSRSCAARGDFVLPPSVTYRQFDYWCSKGYLRTQGDANPGNGYHRHLPAMEEQVLGIMAGLAADGVAPAVAARVARDLVYIGRANLGGITIRYRH